MKKFKVSKDFCKNWLAFILIVTIGVMILFFSSCGPRIPRKIYTGIIVKQLDNDTIIGRRGEVLIWYNYVVKEINNPELQLIRRLKGFHTLQDTLIYSRQIVPNK